MHLNIRCPPLSTVHEKTRHIYANMPLLVTLALFTRSFLLSLPGKLFILQSPFFYNHLPRLISRNNNSLLYPSFVFSSYNMACDGICHTGLLLNVPLSLLLFNSPYSRKWTYSLLFPHSLMLTKWLYEGKRNERQRKGIFSDSRGPENNL